LHQGAIENAESEFLQLSRLEGLRSFFRRRFPAIAPFEQEVIVGRKRSAYAKSKATEHSGHLG
jgi:hypothetical protein